ncbi:MAG: hypothetical protein RLZZ335_577 [Bacteroidota bacterium]|jgi:hypothetical protein
MKRRTFLKKAGLTAAGTLVLPYLLPSGRLFAATGRQLANHVVYVMFAGGVRQQESVLQRYLDDSQQFPVGGNIMLNMLNGAQPAAKRVYGTDVAGEPRGSAPIPAILPSTLQSLGTLFPEVRATTAGHFSGLNTLLTGNTGASQGLREKPLSPTIFEYLRRHGGIPASKVWFVGNRIGNSIPLLNYSEHPSYGIQYGGNFLAPNVTFSPAGRTHLSNARIYHPEEELEPMLQMKYFLNNSYTSSGGIQLPEIGNTDEEKDQIRAFVRDTFARQQQGQIAMPPVADNGDLRNVGFACEVIKAFKPALTVVNMDSVDGCHSNFTGYLRSLHRADHAVGFLWNFIQNQVPEMAGNTIFIISPEHGRNLNPNPIKDENDWFAYDHSDQNSMRVFTLMAGPNVPQNMTVGSATNPVGSLMDNVLTIGDILGVKQSMVSSGLISGQARSLFDRI